MSFHKHFLNQRHVLQIFLDTSATLSAEFMNYLSLAANPSCLAELANEYELILQQSTEGMTFIGKLNTLLRLEKHLSQMVFGKDMETEYESKEIQVDVVLPDMMDKGVSCNIPQPLFSRCGRRVKIKSELYDSDDEVDIPRKKLYAKPVVSQTDSSNPLPEIPRRKRGRPPKKKPKMIHVGEGKKDVTITHTEEVEANQLIDMIEVSGKENLGVGVPEIQMTGRLLSRSKER